MSQAALVRIDRRPARGGGKLLVWLHDDAGRLKAVTARTKDLESLSLFRAVCRREGVAFGGHTLVGRWVFEVARAWKAGGVLSRME